MSWPKLLLSLAILPFFNQAAMAEFASTDAPAAPSNFSVKAVGVNAFQVKWKDNSDDENGWEIQYLIKNTIIPLQKFIVGTADAESQLVVTSDFAASELTFQLRAYKTVEGKQKFSKATPKITVKTPATAIFEDPAGLKAKATGDGSVRLTWKDNSNCETGYLVEYKKPADKSWEVLGNLGPDERFNIRLEGFFIPATQYMFRVQAMRAGIFSKYSNPSKVTTRPFLAPSNLVVTPESDGVFSFKWKDNSTAEAGFEFQRKTGDGAFEVLGRLAKNVTSAPDVTGFTLNEDFQFRMRGYRTVGTKTVYSAFSNTVVTKATSVAKPTGVKAVAKDEYAVKVTWKDVSTRESSYKVQYRKAGTTDAFKDAVAASNAVELEVGNLVPGMLYDFKVAAIATDLSGVVNGVGVSPTVQGRTKDGIASTLNPAIFYGVPFAHDILISRSSELKTLVVTNLPDGLGYDGTLRRVSGTLNEEGVKTFTVTATFNDDSTVAKTITLRVIRPARPPVANAPFDAVNVAAAANTNVSLTGKFSDPDTASAARFTTTKGSFDVILYSLAAPATVDNFLDYIDADRYDNTFFHRSVDTPASQLVILQGGGYSYTSANGFKQVTKFTGAIANEPGISNMRGTVGLAKLGSAANSGSSEFYINMDDVNAGNLDTQNTGFTVFGRIPEAGLDTIETIHDLPTGEYSISGFASSIFTDVPMDAVTAPAAMEPAKLVKITGVAAAPILTYGVESQNPAVATASLGGTTITIHGVAAGSTNIVVTATDLDGNGVSQNIAVTVP